MTWRTGARSDLAKLTVVLGSLFALETYAAPLVRARFPTLAELLRTVLTVPFFRLGELELTALLLVKSLVLLGVIHYGTRATTKFVRRRVLDNTALEEGRKYAIQRVVGYVVFTVGSLAALQTLGLNLSSLTVFGGALGIGLGFGFQSITKNFAAGLVLLINEPIKAGDRVDVNGIQGNVIFIGARGTWVCTNDNVVMIIPNSDLVDGMVTNLTANDRTVRIRAPFGVSYGSDPEHVRGVVEKAVRDHPDLEASPPPNVIFLGFGDSSLDFELRIWTRKRVATPRVMRSELYFRVFAAFKREGIEIPFPQRDLHVRSVAPETGLAARDRAVAPPMPETPEANPNGN